MLSSDGAKIVQDGFFQGYTPVVWLVVLLQGATGILVALVMKYADNIVSVSSSCMLAFAFALRLLVNCLKCKSLQLLF